MQKSLRHHFYRQHGQPIGWQKTPSILGHRWVRCLKGTETDSNPKIERHANQTYDKFDTCICPCTHAHYTGTRARNEF
jgi:hypothetical protein